MQSITKHSSITEFRNRKTYVAMQFCTALRTHFRIRFVLKKRNVAQYRTKTKTIPLTAGLISL